LKSNLTKAQLQKVVSISGGAPKSTDTKDSLAKKIMRNKKAVGLALILLGAGVAGGGAALLHKRQRQQEAIRRSHLFYLNQRAEKSPGRGQQQNPQITSKIMQDLEFFNSLARNT
jgi:uncharacterized protein HemX